METEEKLMIGTFITIMTGVIAFVIFSIFFSLMTPGQGQHTGYITAVETYGIIWDTTRAYVKTDTQSSQEDMYCVQDEEVINQLKKVQESKEKVTIEFKSPLIIPNWKCGDESSVIINIKK